jgi:type II secretory pathway pseudopilin PulG
MAIKHTQQQAGFALLMTLIVVGVVAAIGISILDVSLKQVQLSTNAKESEVAFHAANAGMECARYIRRTQSDAMERGTAIANPNCFSGTVTQSPVDRLGASNNVSAANGEAYVYVYEITWQGGKRCSEIVTLVASSTFSGSGLSISGMDDLIDGFPGATKSCGAGERCTVLSVRGYNKSCNEKSAYGTVQREVLLQF